MITLEIETGNAAFEECLCAEVARILRETANRVENGDTEFTIRDINGNKVGTIAERL